MRVSQNVSICWEMKTLAIGHKVNQTSLNFSKSFFRWVPRVLKVKSHFWTYFSLDYVNHGPRELWKNVNHGPRELWKSVNQEKV